MLESTFLAEEMGLNHIVKLCWFTRFEMALSMDESNSECMIGAVGARASQESFWGRGPRQKRVSNSLETGTLVIVAYQRH
jgi:hypothetical protein